MTNRNSLNSSNGDFTEEGLKPSDLVDTVHAVTYRQLDSDNTGGSHNTTTPTLITTLTVGAGVVNKFIDLLVDINHNMKTADGVGSPTGAEDYYVRIDIGETSSETTKKTWREQVALSTSDGVNLTILKENTNVFYYEPTAAEKTNGFNVQIYCYVGNIESSGVGVANSAIKDSWVMGA